tara:strand:- start:137 stop:730 length:594 start_codon:yes stop_codon:yes gene_type:complete
MQNQKQNISVVAESWKKGSKKDLQGLSKNRTAKALALKAIAMLHEIYSSRFDATHPNAIDENGEAGFLWQKAMTSKTGGLFSEAVLESCFDHLPAKHVPNPLEFRDAMQKACDVLCEISAPKQLIPQIKAEIIPTQWSGTHPTCGMDKLDAQTKRNFEKLSDEEKVEALKLKGREYAVFMMSKLGISKFAKKMGVRL